MTKLREKFSCYEFEIWEFWPDCHRDKCLGYCYSIYTEGCHPYDDGVIESDEYFESTNKARLAAIGHITLLENGEG